MKTIIATLATLITINASADGFSCLTDAGDLKVSVYNKVNPNDGTRSASTMIVSDPTVMSGRKTIVKFSADNETLDTAHTGNNRLIFVGDVDLRYTDASRKGEYLMGTRLGEADTIRLDVDFTYGDDLQNGDQVEGLVILVKRNGERVIRAATCTRYLKGA